MDSTWVGSGYVHHPTHLRILSSGLKHNLQAYRNYLNQDTLMMVMVKAFGYGLDAAEVALWLEKNGVDYMGVAYLDEGRLLREAGVRVPILVMNPFEDELRLADRYNLEVSLYSPSLLARYRADRISAPVHIKLDTGMNRLGFRPEKVSDLAQELQQGQVPVKAVFTHLSSSEEETHDDFTQRQLQLFDEAFVVLSEALGHGPLRHVLNSPGIVRFSAHQFEMVRLGIGLYGHDPSGVLNLKPAAEWVSKISQVHQVKQGESIGYGRMGRATADMEVAVVPVGYADGYRRDYGLGRARMSVKNRQVPTVGHICMDMCMLDVTGLDAQAGDDVVIFGAIPSIEELAAAADTMPYEILTQTGARIRRVFVS